MDRGGTPIFNKGEIYEPLLDDHHIHEPKDRPQKDYLRDEFSNYFDSGFVVSSVVAFNDYSEGHLEDPKDNGELHFERIGEGELFRGGVPPGVNAEGVHALSLLAKPVLVVARQPKGHQGNGGEVIVHKPAVEGKETHQEQQVPDLKEHVQGMVLLQP